MKLFLPHSGNLGDTSAILPSISGHYKDTGRKITLILREKMRQFVGLQELYEAQPGIKKVYFETDGIEPNISICLSNEFVKIDHRPVENNRYAINFSRIFNTSCDDDFELVIPEKYRGLKFPETEDKQIACDRVEFGSCDKRRKFNILNEFKDELFFIDVAKPLGYNLALIKDSPDYILGTFTGIAVLVDLMWKEQILIYPNDLIHWDGSKSKQELFERHFYTNRRSEWMIMEDYLREIKQ